MSQPCQPPIGRGYLQQSRVANQEARSLQRVLKLTVYTALGGRTNDMPKTDGLQGSLDHDSYEEYYKLVLVGNLRPRGSNHNTCQVRPLSQPRADKSHEYISPPCESLGGKMFCFLLPFQKGGATIVGHRKGAALPRVRTLAIAFMRWLVNNGPQLGMSKVRTVVRMV